MKKRLLSLFLALIMVLGMLPTSGLTASAEEDYELRVLTFEDADYKGGTNFAGGNNWSSLVDDPQNGGPLLYGDGGMGFSTAEDAYTWYDENNTELTHTLPYNYYAYCYWGGGHAISHYVSGNYTTYGDYMSQLTVYQEGISDLQTVGGG